jgi:predicted metalloprotease with PDZ domain
MRGGGDAVHLYIDQTQPQAAFLDDWVLIHELSHLLHPYMEGDGRWLYEGIASCYQNILPARAGWRTEQDTWSRLHAGFRRGQKGTRPGQTLIQASRDMLRERAFMRVYWSGAAIVLLADLELRQASGGAQSLDWALAELRRREGPFDRGWSPRGLIAGLDRVTGRQVFAQLAERWLDSDRFPDLESAYRALGLETTSDTEVRLRPNDLQAANLRRLLLQSD